MYEPGSLQLPPNTASSKLKELNSLISGSVSEPFSQKFRFVKLQQVIYFLE